ncbi:hypothetical protein [Parasitella parasitica]|uniref:Pre-mRNA-splicing factor SYF2 n=1 Tax=Parasitella parasitica TaxID=35722 RepID=A0A0B7N2I2_9FUNG|nr:hypothetical protein [Parasitella parasitica]
MPTQHVVLGEMIPFDVILAILQYADQGTIYEFSLTCQTISPHALRQLWHMPYITNFTALYQLTDTLRLAMPLHPYSHWVTGLALHFNNTAYEAIPDQIFNILVRLNLEILSLGQLHVDEETEQFKQFLCCQLNQGIAEIHIYRCTPIVLHTLFNAIQNQIRPHLHSLCVNKCYLSDRHLMPLIAFCPGLKNLKLKSCGCLSDEGLVAIASNCKLLDTLVVTLPSNIVQSNAITTRTLEALETHCLLLRSFVCGGQIRITEHITEEPRPLYRFSITTSTFHLPASGVGLNLTIKMPPKKKTAAKKIQIKEEEIDETVKKETSPVESQETETHIDRAPAKRKHSDTKEESSADTQATEVDQGNRRDRNLEFQRSKENPKLEARDERKKAEALKLLEKQEAEDKGEDYERKQFWKYSAESAMAWEKKMAKKARMANNGFTDHSQAAHKKYIRLMSEFKPDMGAYTEKRMLDIERAIRNGEDPSDISAMANSLDYARLDDKPSKEAVDRLAEATKKQIQQRETRSRDRKEQPDDISWINEKNRVFNQKIARFYDKYTKEIRENLERGTAL